MQFTKNWSKSFPNNLDWNQLQAQYSASVYIIEDYTVKHRSPFPVWGEQLSEHGYYAKYHRIASSNLVKLFAGVWDTSNLRGSGGF